MARTDAELETVWEDFHTLVNMSSPELRDWLLAAPVWDDAYAPEPGIDVPALGERVFKLLGKRRTDATDADVELMREVTDLIRGRLEQPPPTGAQDETWRHTLMTLGHDPLKPA